MDLREWIIRSRPEGPAPADWARRLEISPLLLDILWARGLDGCEAMDDFLKASLGKVTPPMRWPQIPEAARLLVDELLAGKRLLVWGDYDVDGITGTTLVLDVLEAHGFDVEWYIPNRWTDGYGVNKKALQGFIDRGIDVLLTVDCGISDVEEVELARENGVTVIVSDHHLPPGTPVAANAVCNPRTMPPDEVPCAHLAGVGVAFYLMGAVNALLKPHTGISYDMKNVLDLVALGTVADVMPLKGENRNLVRGGLARMDGTGRPGIVELKAVGGMNPTAAPSAGQVSFTLAPRINAAGRMDDGSVALRLLRAKEPDLAHRLAVDLNNFNIRRQEEEGRTVDEATRMAEEQIAAGRVGLALYRPEWSIGLVGIVASRIAESLNRPVILFCDSAAGLKGSGRSVHGFHLYEGLAEIADCMLHFGGHKHAAGVLLAPERLEEFGLAFDGCVRKVLGDDPGPAPLTVECELDFARACDRVFLEELELLQPYGTGNGQPVFMSPPLKVRKRKYLGKSNEHVVLEVEDTVSGVSIYAKGWRMGDVIPLDIVGRKVRIAYTLRLDTYRGIAGIDLAIKDWRFDEGESGA
jgi:single-stranded-DNA-specific exonuclease